MNYVKSFTDFLYCLWSNRSHMNSVFLKILAVSLVILLQQSLKNNNRVVFFLEKYLQARVRLLSRSCKSTNEQKQLLYVCFSNHLEKMRNSSSHQFNVTSEIVICYNKQKVGDIL